MKKNIFLLSAITICMFSACTTTQKTVNNSAKPVEKSAATDTQLVEGKAIYTTKCGVGSYGCHSLYTVSMFTKDDWKITVPAMAPRAKLTAAEEKLVLLYVLNGAKK